MSDIGSAGTEPAAHPIPRRRRVPIHIAAPAIVALGVAGVVLSSAWESLRPSRTVGVVPVVTRIASGESAPRVSDTTTPRTTQTVQAAGWLEADPYYISCTALADGVVEEILALEGESVEAGQVVARLVAEDAELALARAEAELESARADLEAAVADLEAAQTEWENPVDRQRRVEVARALIAEIDGELERLSPQIASEEAVLKRYEIEVERARKAVETGASNEIELIRLEQSAAEQLGMLEATRRYRAILEARLTRQRADLRAEEENLRLRITERQALGRARAMESQMRARIARGEVEVGQARLRLERMTIRSPITGLVQKRLKAPGDKVMLGMDDPMSAHILHLYDPSRIQVRVDVPLADASHVFVGQSCEIVVEVLPDRTFVGRVSRITHEADVQKNTLEIKVEVTNPSPLLKPEMLTRVRFLPSVGSAPGSGEDASAESGTTMLVPKESVTASGSSGVLWVVRDRRASRGRLERLSVSLGEVNGGWIRVLDGVRPTDLVVVAPDDSLSPNQSVRVSAHAGDRS